VDLAASIAYRGVGTVEFIHDPVTGTSAFLEMNTRIQVEHPVTEAVTGCDLVGMQLDIAAGDAALPAQRDVVLAGHAVEVRIAAEDPSDGFRPCPGRITGWDLPEHSWLRIDSGVEEGSVVGLNYDSMIAKLIVHGADRPQALARLHEALTAVRIDGLETNVGFLAQLVEHPMVTEDRVHTTWLDEPDVVASLSSHLT
jgi:acetyl-CoA carboxylase biotin carboxylase subunit